MSVEGRHFLIRGPRADSGMYEVIKFAAGGRDIEIVVSPTGRSVRIYIDGVERPKVTA